MPFVKLSTYEKQTELLILTIGRHIRARGGLQEGRADGSCHAGQASHQRSGGSGKITTEVVQQTV
jgi:hypothetical protein